MNFTLPLVVLLKNLPQATQLAHSPLSLVLPNPFASQLPHQHTPLSGLMTNSESNTNFVNLLHQLPPIWRKCSLAQTLKLKRKVCGIT
jgi:hypothetical protein